MKTIIIRDGELKKVLNIKGFIEMRLRKVIDRLACQIVEDGLNTVVFHVKTSNKIFEEIRIELDKLYPGSCIYLTPKTES